MIGRFLPGLALAAFWLLCAWVVQWSWVAKDRRSGRQTDRPGYFDRRGVGTPEKPETIPGVSASSEPVGRATWSAETERALAVFEEVVKSRNDNDPRMDRELRNLTPEAQAALREKYAGLAMESRNTRGLIVFLLGRGVQVPTVENLAFFGSVLSEPECLSLSDCQRAADQGSGTAHDSAEMGLSVTLSYPQRMALRMIERSLRDRKSWTSLELEAAEKALNLGRASTNAWIARRSSDLLSRMKSVAKNT